MADIKQLSEAVATAEANNTSTATPAADNSILGKIRNYRGDTILENYEAAAEKSFKMNMESFMAHLVGAYHGRRIVGKPLLLVLADEDYKLMQPVTRKGEPIPVGFIGSVGEEFFEMGLPGQPPKSVLPALETVLNSLRDQGYFPYKIVGMPVTREDDTDYVAPAILVESV